MARSAPPEQAAPVEVQRFLESLVAIFEFPEEIAYSIAIGDIDAAMRQAIAMHKLGLALRRRHAAAVNIAAGRAPGDDGNRNRPWWGMSNQPTKGKKR